MENSGILHGRMAKFIIFSSKSTCQLLGICNGHMAKLGIISSEQMANVRICHGHMVNLGNLFSKNMASFGNFVMVFKINLSWFVQ